MPNFARPGQELWRHLTDVSYRASQLASLASPTNPDFETLAAWAGMVHDLGKYRKQFQDLILGLSIKSRATQHAIFGAAWAADQRMKSVAVAVQGHHAGLNDWDTIKDCCLSTELDPRGVSRGLLIQLETDLSLHGHTLPRRIVETWGRVISMQDEFRIRMLFSCLIDADRLDVEKTKTGREREPIKLDAAALLALVEAEVAKLGSRVGVPELADVRRQVYAACLQGAQSPTGFFSLTTPTGGGKTLASMAFALKHAKQNMLRRVIVVLPFLSIIEQNAKVYRKLFGDSVVLEHHSATGCGKEEIADDEPDEIEAPGKREARLAVENWDAPIVVTTAVQFFESLFARRPSRCRKLHNIARSVVIIDEVQTLPLDHLEPILSALRDLREHYGTSVLFCSATQPRPKDSARLLNGFTEGEVVELAPKPPRLFARLRRVRYELPVLKNAWTMDELADRVAEHDQALVILNLRRQAIELFDKLNERRVNGLFHLSSTMCASHRYAKLGDREEAARGSIYDRLKRKKPCVVVSTQVVEAGVDIDFPTVYRHLGPLDAIIQAAGRCNREGKIRVDENGGLGGRVIVFELSGGKRNMPQGLYEQASILAKTALGALADDPSRLETDPQLFADYFQRLIAWRSTDAKAIQAMRGALRFKAVAEAFRMIGDDGQSVFVPYRSAVDLIKSIRTRQHYTFKEIRNLQPYAVNLRRPDIQGFGASIRPLIHGDDAFLTLDDKLYDGEVGVRLGEPPVDVFVQTGEY